MNEPRPTSYWDYIQTEQLLSLQHGLGHESDLHNDEVMFIVVHQIDELWFKLALRELIGIRDLFKNPHVPEQTLSSAARGLKRTTLIFKKLSDHFELMETLTTRDYLNFRDKLTPASGFQSAGLREVEILMGLKDEDRIPLGSEGSYLKALKNPDGTESPASIRVQARLQDTPTLKEAVQDWLYRTPIQASTPGQPGDAEVVDGFIEQYLDAYTQDSAAFTHQMQRQALTPEDQSRLEKRHLMGIEGARRYLHALDVEGEKQAYTKRIRAALLFIESYRELPLLAWPRDILDELVALEQAMVIFRQRHARMVERVIGRRTGTGGSAGVQYLDETALKYRMFPDLWAIRTLLLKTHQLPDVQHPEFYQTVK